jgi:hypothetical protein
MSGHIKIHLAMCAPASPKKALIFPKYSSPLIFWKAKRA